jgi:hypothetical protein
MSVTALDGHLSKQRLETLVRENLHRFPKMRYKLAMRAGDIYYQKMSEEEALRKGFIYEETPDRMLRNQKEVDCFVRDNLSRKMPLDGPQFRMIFQRFKDDDGQEFLIQIWMSHHCLMDGVSGMAVQACFSDEFSPDYFLPFRNVSIFTQMLLRISFPFYLPLVILSAAFTERDDNCFTRGKASMKGELNCATSSRMHIADIKSLAKSKGVTVNDIVLSATSVAFNQTFKAQPVGNSTPSEVQVLIPANIRFRMYQNKNDARMENKFAGLPLRVPLLQSMSECHKVKEVTKKIKN